MRPPIVFSLLLAYVTSLECHLGYSILKGSTIGEATKKCGRDSDFCYNATAQIFSLTTLQKAGCNTLICQFVPNSCYERKILGVPVKFCCCKNEDLCNRGQMTGAAQSFRRNASLSNEVASLEQNAVML